MSTISIPPILSLLIGHIAAAVPRRARITFTELLIGAAATRGGHVTDAILAAGWSRGGPRSYWLLQRGRWTWLAVWQALLRVLKMLFDPPVWHVVLDDTLVERISARAPGSLIHYNHTAKPNRPRFLRGQGWLCLAAVVEHEWKVGAVPLMLRLVRRGPHRGKLKSAGFLLRLLGNRLGRGRVLLDAWFMRAWLIECTLAASQPVIGRVRRDLALRDLALRDLALRDLALYEVPKPPGPRGRGRPRKYGARMTRHKIEALPVHRTAQILYGNLDVVRYRTCRVAARFLKGRVVRAVWVQLEQPDRGDQPTEERRLICTDPDLSAITVITSYAKRWSIEPLFAAIKHGWGLKDAWQQSRQVLMRWVTILAAGYALNQMLAHTAPARIPGLANPAPWRPAGARTAGLIQAGITRILRVVGLPALMALTSPKSDLQDVHAAPVLASAGPKAA